MIILKFLHQAYSHFLCLFGKHKLTILSHTSDKTCHKEFFVKSTIFPKHLTIDTWNYLIFYLLAYTDSCKISVSLSIIFSLDSLLDSLRFRCINYF